MIYPYLYYYLSIKVRKNNCTTKIIRIISGCKYQDDTSNYFKELHILKFPFPDINILQTSLFMFKVHHILPLHLTKVLIGIAKSISIVLDHPRIVI